MAPRFVFDLSSLVRWFGSPVGMIRVQQHLARYARRELPNTVFTVFDPSNRAFKAIRPEWIDAIIANRAATDRTLLLEPARPRPRFLYGHGRHAASLYFAVAKTRRWLIAMLERWRLSAPSAWRRAIAAIQSALMKPRERSLYFDGAERRACPPLDVLVGETIALGSDDTLLSVQFDWFDTDIDAILAEKRTTGFRHVVLCHDIIPLIFPDWFSSADVDAFTRYFGKAFAGADRIVFTAASNETDARAYCRRLGFGLDDTAVVPLGADVGQHATGDAAALPPGLEAGRYALFVSTIEPRKNHRVLVDAWKQLAAEGVVADSGFKLVFAGRKGWKVDEFYVALAADPQFGKSIVHLDTVDDALLDALYRGAAFCLYPSIYEGFGLPLVEAMAHGKPMVVSSGGALPEVLGERGVVLDPHDVGAWRDEIRRMIVDTDYRHRWSGALAAYKPADWDTAAGTFFAAASAPVKVPAADTAAASVAPTPASARLAIAMGIYRLAPRGGLEDHCIRIAEALSARGHDVTIFVASDAPDLPIRVERLTEAGAASTNHERMRRFADAFHAATRNGFDRTVAFQTLPGADLLFVANPIRDRDDIAGWRRLTPRFRTYAALEHGSFAAPNRTRIMTLTEADAAALRDRYAVEPDRLAVLPPTASDTIRRPAWRTEATRNRFRAEVGIEPSAPVWLWCGLQPTVKGLDRVINALRQDTAAHLMICGLGPRDHRLASTARLARRLHVADRVHPLGFIPHASDAFFRALAAADVLAHPARLDVTGMVILEAIVNGLPVVASAACGFSGMIVDSDAGKVVPEPFDQVAFDRALADVCGSDNKRLSENGVRYGGDPRLYAGIARAVELIEAPLDRPWTVDGERVAQSG